MRNILIVSLLALFLVAGCNQNEKTPNSTIDKTTNYREAQLLKFVETHFSNPNGHYQLGKYYENVGMYDKAQYEFNLTLSLSPNHREAQAASVKILTLKNEKTKASQLAEIYISQAAVMAQDALRLGRAFQAESLDDYALQCYQKAAIQVPNSAAIQKQLGYFYLTKGEKQKAQEAFRRSFQSDPYQADVAGELGKLGVAVEVPKPKESDPVGDTWEKVKGIFVQEPQEP